MRNSCAIFLTRPAVCLLLCCVCLTAGAMTRQEYIAKYAHLAVSEMNRTGIPASITLAQALLESDNGNSALSKASNNHFGIKCKSGWTGATVRYDDDEAQECFRKYSTVNASYKDHSDFLRSQERYAELFTYPRTDYKRWARGLKAAGYATSPTYADNLIRIIEENNLTRFDNRKGISSARNSTADTNSATGTWRRNWLGQLRPGTILLSDAEAYPESYTILIERTVLKNNGVKYILAHEDDSLQSIAADLRCSIGKLRRCNEMTKQYVPQAGEMVYIQAKRSRVAQKGAVHIVKTGESLRSIAQRYGIRTQALYKMNGMQPGDVLRVGMELRLHP